MSSLVKLEGITKVYQQHSSIFRVLNGINFQLKKGEMVAIVGASGSGKSTLMNIIGFLDHCTHGKYFFNQEDVSHLSDIALAKIRNQKIGFIFQSFFLLPRLNVLQNVMLPLFYRGIGKQKAEKKSCDMLEKVGMIKWRHHKPQQLSGGQQQRVAIARALVNNPEVILADEPTGSLDSKTGAEIMNLFIQLNQTDNRTLIIVTHDQSMSQQCQRIVTIKDGSLIA